MMNNYSVSKVKDFGARALASLVSLLDGKFASGQLVLLDNTERLCKF